MAAGKALMAAPRVAQEPFSSIETAQAGKTLLAIK
jgi:hypothetical protein